MEYKSGVTKKLLLLISAIFAVFVLISAYIFFHPDIVIYSGQLAYTMADDGEVYLKRFPMCWVERNYIYSHTSFRPPSFHAMDVFDSTALFSKLIDRYDHHFNLDFTVHTEGEQIIVTYMGYGKRPDGTIETIDETVTGPYFPFEDQTEGLWEPPLAPGETRPPDILNDPNFVFDPK